MPISSERILFEDQWLLAVTKLSGELVVAGKGPVGKLPLLDFLKKQYPSLHPVHRLDFETSGVVVFAKSRSVLSSIVKSSFSGWVKKYHAIVLGVPRKPSGTIDKPLPARSGRGSVAAKTSYKLLEAHQGISLLECQLERGQKHQIRKHCAFLGHPLILDSVYGENKANKSLQKYLKMQRFFLHAASVDFPHPVTGTMMHIESPRPAPFDRALKMLSKA